MYPHSYVMLYCSGDIRTSKNYTIRDYSTPGKPTVDKNPEPDYLSAMDVLKRSADRVQVTRHSGSIGPRPASEWPFWRQRISDLNKKIGLMELPAQLTVSGYSCPECGSDRTQNVMMAYREGISSLESVHAAIFAFSDPEGFEGPLLGFSQGTSISGLAESVSPPEERSIGIGALMKSMLSGFLALLAVSIMFAPSAYTISFALAMFVISVALSRSVQREKEQIKEYNEAIYPLLVQEWREKFICLRCGIKFKPHQEIDSEEHISNTEI